MTKSDHELVAAGTHVFCKCKNAIPVAATKCPYCHRFNSASSAGECSLCGAAKEHWKKEE